MHDNEGGSKGKTGDRGVQQGTSNRPGDAEKGSRKGGQDNDDGMDAAKGSRSGAAPAEDNREGSGERGRSGSQGESQKGSQAGKRGQKRKQDGD